VLKLVSLFDIGYITKTVDYIMLYGIDMDMNCAVYEYANAPNSYVYVVT